MKVTMNTSQLEALSRATTHVARDIYSLDWFDVRNDIVDEGSVIAEIRVSMPDLNRSHGLRFLISSDGMMYQRDYNGDRVTFDIASIWSARIF